MKSLQIKIKETDLYKPIHDYLIDQGYTVRSEVKNCDIVALKGDELIIIELKCSFNATLLIQATHRQKSADSVYIGIPKPKGGTFSKDWDGMCHLLKRLELGLITVSFKNIIPDVEIVFHPAPYSPKKNKKTRASIIREVAGRNADYNVGGSNKQKLMTAYKESAIHIACCLEKFGPLSPKQLRNLGASSNTLSILSRNFYGWFNKISKGIYELDPAGRSCFTNYPKLTAHYNNEIEKTICLKKE